MAKQLLCVVAVLSLVAGATAQTYTETILHSFAGGTQDGAQPSSALVMDTTGNLYGTASGGTKGFGVVFKISPAGKETILYNFKGGTDGMGPNGLAIDKAGNLFGTTFGENDNGNGNENGTLFKITFAGKYSILHKFGQKTGDGLNPRSPILDSAGNIYGTTQNGGAFQDNSTNSGTIFKVTPKGVETVLYSFFGAGMNLLRDGPGNIYSTTIVGGMAGGDNDCGEGCGTVFEINTKGTETVLYNFCQIITTMCVDGAAPGYIVRNANGSIFGSAVEGAYESGVIWEVTAQDVESTLYSFCPDQSVCADGQFPSGPMLSLSGNLYGTTSSGGCCSTPGVNGQGVVYELTTSGVETVLWSFLGGQNDGSTPTSGIIADSAGNLYGITLGGGTHGVGTVFKLTKN
jgi:uncharacterized repeat protein (TIGR03803 family)